MSCVCCGGPEQIGHHVSYDPERRVPVCRACHTRIHSPANSHGLEPDHTPIERTRTKREARFIWPRDAIERLEALVIERDLVDINHAVELLCENQMTEEETEAARDYTWNPMKHDVEHISERSKRMAEVREGRGW
jgi:hypothetical protein